MVKIALFGAGGKMGVRSARNLLNSDFEVAHVEISDAGQARLKAETGEDCVPAEQALKGADAVVLAVPDTAIRAASHAIIDMVEPGTMVICLDAAAPFAGHLPKRDDITYFVTHPCHPPIFNDEETPEGRNDHFGGIAARQGIVNALMQGPEAHYALGESIGREAELLFAGLRRAGVRATVILQVHDRHVSIVLADHERPEPVILPFDLHVRV